MGDNCPECQANTDPRKVPVHPNCNCEVITEDVELGVEPESWRPTEQWLRENGVLRFIQGNTGLPPKEGPRVETVQFDAATVTVLDIQDARFSDVQSWLDKVQPYLESGDFFLSIVAEGDELVDTAETVSEIATATEVAGELLNRRMVLALLRAVT